MEEVAYKPFLKAPPKDTLYQEEPSARQYYDFRIPKSARQLLFRQTFSGLNTVYTVPKGKVFYVFNVTAMVMTRGTGSSAIYIYIDDQSTRFFNIGLHSSSPVQTIPIVLNYNPPIILREGQKIIGYASNTYAYMRADFRGWEIDANLL